MPVERVRHAVTGRVRVKVLHRSVDAAVLRIPPPKSEQKESRFVNRVQEQVESVMAGFGHAPVVSSASSSREPRGWPRVIDADGVVGERGIPSRVAGEKVLGEGRLR